MKPPEDRFTIFVVCDDASHTKSQAVTNFVRVLPEDEEHHRPGQYWDEWFPGRRKSGTGSAVTLVDNQQPSLDSDHMMGMHREEDRAYWGRARQVFELECRKCHKPFEFRLERLFAVLDQIFDGYRISQGDVGVLPVPLRVLAARMEALPSVDRAKAPRSVEESSRRWKL